MATNARRNNMNQITNNRPETFAELRQMIAQAKKIYVQAWINDGDRTYTHQEISEEFNRKGR